MFAFVDYKGLQVGSVTPSEAGGIAIDGNMRAIADRAGPVAEVNGAPGVTDDDAGGAGNGTFFTWSKWRDTSNDDVYICVDPATGAAVWKLLTGGGGGGLNKSGLGTFVESGTGANVGGNIAGAGSSIDGIGNGSLTVVDNTASAIDVFNESAGGVLTGGTFFGSVGTMSLAGIHSWMHASLFVPSGTAEISVNADFGWLHGRTSGDSQLKVNQDAAMILYGFAGGGAVVTISGASTAIVHADTSNLDIDGFMNFAVGFLDGSTNPATLAVLSPPQPNETTTVFMVAHSADGGSVTIGDAAVQMIGGSVLGSAIGAAAILRATRSGGSASGAATAGQTIESVAVNAHQFCEGSNDVANSLQVGAVGTGIHLHADGLPAAPAGGDIWNVTGDVFVRTGGTSLNLSSLGGTKSITFPITLFTGQNRGDHRVDSLGATGVGRYNFSVPDDFGTLTSLELIGIPMAGAAGGSKDIDLFSDYGTVGENFANHSESDTTTVYDFTGDTDLFISIDLSVVFSSLVAGDFCGVQVDHNSIGGAIDYKLIKMVYTPA